MEREQRSMKDNSTVTETLKTDIIIIGGGGAGMAAAVQAAEKGAKVILLEKRGAVGGNTSMAHGFFAAESPIQKRMMIDAPKDELFKVAMDYHHWTINPRLVRTFINKSGDTARWLEEKGLKIELVPALHPRYHYRTFHMTSDGTGHAVIKLLTRTCEDLGVKILEKSTVKKLLVNKNGKVAGVLASNENGTLKVEAKSIIIATGGYGGNKTLLKKHCPNYVEGTKYFGLKELTGDGLSMSAEIGAATEGLGMPHYWGGYYSGANIINLINKRPEMIWVNKAGERYCDETILFDMGLRGNVIDRQPDKVSYTIFDERMKEKLISEGPIGAQMALRWAPPDTTWGSIMEKLPSESEKGNLKVADSPDDIAGWMGARPETLRATLNEYNNDCNLGYDSLFVKDRRYLEPLNTPPYYAVKFQQTLLDTMGGIKTNHHMEVLDQENNPIKGLFAAGVCVGGYTSATYCYILSGTMFGFALNSGRIAAENAVRLCRISLRR
jgi:fumarate reductase flavoprotein subunit